VLTVTLFSAAVVYAYEKDLPVTFTNSITPLLSVVVSDFIMERILALLTSCDEVRLGLF
jgi:hypothetical protein